MYEQQQTTKKENKGEVDFFQLKEMMKRFSQMHKNYHIEENKSPAFAISKFLSMREAGRSCPL